MIRSFNEERRLPALLAALERQSYRDFETIVVDSGSYDRTLAIARDAGARLLEVASADFTFGHSLNVGIAAARGRHIAIVSAHAEPVDAAWLGALVAPLGDPSVAMVYGRQLGGPTSKFGETQDFLRTYGRDRRRLVPPHVFANNANSAVRRELWQAHPFDERLTGLEDLEWARHWMQQGYVVAYEPDAAVYHVHDETWWQIRRRYYREAVAARALGVLRPIHLVREVARDVRALAADVMVAHRSGALAGRGGEICRFRAHKTAGMARGLLARSVTPSVERHDALYFDREARAVVVHGPGRAALETVAIPSVKPSEILVEVAWEGVCGTDLEILSGRLGYYRSGVAHYPITPGHEFSGWVSRVGANVRGLKPGDPVVIECIQSCGACPRCVAGNELGCARRSEVGVIGRNGGYAQYVATPARFAHVVPPSLDLRRAALCEPTAVVVKGLKRIQWALAADKKPRCAVVGAGTIGHLCARILAARGHEVTAFDRMPERLTHFADAAVATESSLDDLGRFDVIVEATGDPEALHRLLTESRAGATLLLLGLPYSRREFSFESVVAYDKAIVGSLGSSAADYDDALALLGELPLDAFLQHELPLARFAEAWEGFHQHPGLKTLLRVHG